MSTKYHIFMNGPYNQPKLTNSKELESYHGKINFGKLLRSQFFDAI